MKLKHLIEAYNFNNISAILKQELRNKEESAGVIAFEKGINGSYLLNNEGTVSNLIIFANCLALFSKQKSKKEMLNNQLDHSIKVIKILQKSIELLAHIPRKEANMILEKLGLFDGTFKEGKQIKHIEYSFRAEIKEGLLMFSIGEI